MCCYLVIVGGPIYAKQALKCEPNMLAEVEAFVVSEAEQDSDPATLFALGLVICLHIYIDAYICTYVYDAF